MFVNVLVTNNRLRQFIKFMILSTLHTEVRNFSRPASVLLLVGLFLEISHLSLENKNLFSAKISRRTAVNICL